MEYKKIRSIDDLPIILGILPTGLKRWFKNYPFGNHSDCLKIKNKLLVGKPVIAAFMGISEKTLKRWFVKHPTLPIERTQYRCYALTNNLLLWKVNQLISKLKPSQISAAQWHIVTNHANLMRVTRKYFIEAYVTKSRYASSEPDVHPQIRRTGHYKKTINKTLQLLRLQRSLLENEPEINSWLENFYKLSPPENVSIKKDYLS